MPHIQGVVAEGYLETLNLWLRVIEVEFVVEEPEHDT